MIPDFISLFQLRIRISTTHPYSYFTYSLLLHVLTASTSRPYCTSRLCLLIVFLTFPTSRIHSCCMFLRLVLHIPTPRPYSTALLFFTYSLLLQSSYF